MKRVFLDIETIPTTSPEEMADIAAKVIAENAALKKPHDADEVKRRVDEAHRKTSLDGASGGIVVIAAAVEDGPVLSWQRPSGVPDDEGEALTLRLFRDDIGKLLGGETGLLIGHNALGFDRPFLRHRSIVTATWLPAWMTAALKPWDAVDVDTMLMWTQGQPGKYIGLDRLARALRIPGKTGDITGANVWDAILADRIDDVAAYCRADVELTRSVYNRIKSATETPRGQP